MLLMTALHPLLMPAISGVLYLVDSDGESCGQVAFWVLLTSARRFYWNAQVHCFFTSPSGGRWCEG